MNPQEQTYAIMNPQTTAILEKIREVCPELMELSFGCVVEVQNYVVLVRIVEDRRGFTWVPESGYPNMDFYGIAPSPVHFDEKHIKKIIGHEPHLEHLLRTIPEDRQMYLNTWNGYFYVWSRQTVELISQHIQYNLTLSLTQNLETNPELREFVYKLICE